MRFIVGTRAAESVEAARKLAHDLSESGLDARLLENGLLSTNFWNKRYEVRGLIAPGSRGAVLDVWDHKHGSHRAAKVFDLATRRDWDEEMFKREVSALERVEHPHLPRLIEVLLDDEVGVAVLVMQRLLGANLDHVVKQNGPISPEHVGWMTADVLSALGALHAGKLVHRDVKPSTLILGVDAHVRLVDVGRVGHVKTTGPYAAPEAREGARTSRSDLYSLALTMVALASGKQPDALPRNGANVDVDAACPNLVRSTRRLFQRMLSVDPRERPATVDEVRTHLGTHATAPRPKSRDVDAERFADLADEKPQGTPVFARAKVSTASGAQSELNLKRLEWRPVNRVTYETRPGWNPDVEVLYWMADGTFIGSEFVKPAADTFSTWWKMRGGRSPAPRSAEDAVARSNELTRKIVHAGLLVGTGSNRLRALDLGADVVEAGTGRKLER